MFKKAGGAKCSAKCFGKIAAVICLWNFAFAAIDVVIPAIAKDKPTLDYAIEGIKTHGIDIRRVIVVSPEKLTDKAEWFPEEKFPFDKKAIAKAIHPSVPGNHPRLGWVLQQLLKLYAPFVIPDISDDVLILDADTVFIKRVVFIKRGVPLYSYIYGKHQAYHDCVARLLPNMQLPHDRISGVCHHMLLQKRVLKELFHKVETCHGMEFWRAICKNVDRSLLATSCFSEYELYFQYVFANERAGLRKLEAGNFGREAAKDWKMYRKQGLQIVSFHCAG